MKTQVVALEDEIQENKAKVKQGEEKYEKMLQFMISKFTDSQNILCLHDKDGVSVHDDIKFGTFFTYGLVIAFVRRRFSLMFQDWTWFLDYSSFIRYQFILYINNKCIEYFSHYKCQLKTKIQL